MARDRLHIHLLTAFGISLLVYVLAYSCDARLRHRKGPWRITFQASSNGEPSLLINEPILGITNVQVTFAGETTTNAGGTVVFDVPQKPVPFGQTRFEDLTYLPGSVVLELFGHEVEVLPRTLYLNKGEVPWVNGTNYILRASDKLPPERLADPRKKKRSFF